MDNVPTREDCLRKIVGMAIPPIFTRPQINVEPVIGTIGDRGGGKSASDSVIAVIDGGLEGKKIFSNMNIAVAVEVDDDIARGYGLSKGGTVKIQSEELDKDALLNLDERYKNSYIVIEEINVQYSNVRRFMSNTNVDFNEVCQQLRKFKCRLIYNVINEMFIDPQLRAMTDIFIRTYDTAFDIDSLQRHKPSGLDFCWTIYPMTGYMCGEQGKYSKTQKSVGPVYFNFETWRGIFNTDRYQKQEQYTKTTAQKNKLLELQAKSSPELTAELNEWAWLEQNVISWMERHPERTTMEAGELPQMAGCAVTPAIKKRLVAYGVVWDNNEQYYMLPQQGILPPPNKRPANHKTYIDKDLVKASL